MLPLLLLFLQLCRGFGLVIEEPGSLQHCKLQSLNTSSPTAVCPPNAMRRIDLSSRSLTGRLYLSVSIGSNRSLDRRQQLHLDLLNVSGNPGLTAVSISGGGDKGGGLDSVHIASLDISGTAMAPVQGRFLRVNDARLLSISTLTANGTAYAQPLDLSQAADLFYRMHVHTFTLIGWPLANGRLPANLTRHAANRCGSKYFKSLTISRSRLLREIHGRLGDALTVTDTIDLSHNGLRSVSNVVFSAGRIDLSDNQLADLSLVAFKPGSFCRAAVTGPPTLLLGRNRLRYAALESLVTSTFSGLDLSGNEKLLQEGVAGKEADNVVTKTKISVSTFLDLSGLGGHVSGLAALLARFRLASRSQSSAFNLSLADNWIPDLASAAALVSDFTAVSGSNESRAVPVHLDLSGNPLLVHLNLTDMPPRLLASLTVRRLPHLRSASVRVLNYALVLERLRRRDGRDPKSDAAILADLWSRRVPLQLDARPSRCCLADDGELFCSFGRSSGGGYFCYNSEEPPFDRYQSPELPLLFTCVVLGCALLLGLMTGVAIFYARRRSRGRYAVYSVHSFGVKDQQQQEQHVPQLQQHCRTLPPCSLVHLKAVTVSTIVPIERAATPV